MEQIESVLRTIAIAVDLVGITILLIAALRFLVNYVRFEIKRLGGLECVDGIRELRLGLGSYILLALEFMIVSDIINSGISRNMDDFLLLGLLVLIRTALSFFLGRDLDDVKNQQ
jgi:uncharacterized membrane protein